MSDTDPAIAAGDNEFIKFVAACEKLVQAPGGPIETRDAVAVLTKDLASRWMLPDPNFRQLQADAPYSSYQLYLCLLYTSPSPRDKRQSRMPSSA